MLLRQENNFAYFSRRLLFLVSVLQQALPTKFKNFGVSKAMVVTDKFLADSIAPTHHRITQGRRAQSHCLA